MDVRILARSFKISAKDTSCRSTNSLAHHSILKRSRNLELSNNSTNTTTRPTNLQMIVIRPKPPKTITTAIQSSSSYKDLWATYIKQRSDSLTRIYMEKRAHQHVPQEGIPDRPFLFVNYILHSLTLSLYTCKTIILQIPRFTST